MFYQFGQSPLHAAAKYGEDQTVKYLITQQANVRIKDNVCFLFVVPLLYRVHGFVAAIERTDPSGFRKEGLDAKFVAFF